MLQKVSSEKPKKINPKAIVKSYMETIEDEMKDQGAIFFEPGELLNIDEEYLELPREITEVPSKDLGEYLNAYTQQKVYLRTLLGRCELVVEDCRRAFYKASDSPYKKFSKDKISETAKDRMITTLPEVAPYYEKYMDSLRKKSLVEGSIANIEDIIFMLSREVTRRSGDFSDENRNYNVHRR